MKRSICCALCILLAWISSIARPGILPRVKAANMIDLLIHPDRILLRVGKQSYTFTRNTAQGWALDNVSVDGVKTAVPLSPKDSFFVGGGLASGYTVQTDDDREKKIAFDLGTNRVTYEVRASDRLPLAHIAITGPREATIALRTPTVAANQHGAWVTRGETGSDAENREVFIDGSGPLVFGHSQSGSLDMAYVILADVKPHIQRNGRTEQRSNTWFKSGRVDLGKGNYTGYWQLRMGECEPTRCALLLDRDLGGRFYHVCENYYAPAVDTLVDLNAAASDYDPDKALQKMPLRLSAPDAFIPGYGWTMEEYSHAAYPYAHDSSIQTGNFLVYEGLATGREWERNFGKYILDKTPLVGKDGASFFVRRPGGITRWGYTTDYTHPFPRTDGGNWGYTEALYTTAQITGDAKLKQIALEMMRHDIDVKLDLNRMTFAPCWDVEKSAPGDRRDDWAKTTLLAYSAELCSEILYPQTGDPVYLRKADRICEWFKSILGPETRMNSLNDGVNMYNCWAGWIPLALIHKYERSHDTAYLDLAKDFAWVQIMTLGITQAVDPNGRSFLGVTCVGVRDCIDYDCAPNLCQEKDQVFVNIVGPLLDHASGPAYAKYLQLHKLALPRDRWNDAFGVQELRDINLRTMYDTYMRGMANLIYALDLSSNPKVAVVEKGISKRDCAIGHERDIVLANATAQDQATTLRIRYLTPGMYRLIMDGKDQGQKTDKELGAGLSLAVPANATQSIKVGAISLHAVPEEHREYDDSVTYLSDLKAMDAQRGVGLPTPIFVTDRSFSSSPLRLAGTDYKKGIGCAANTVILYRLGGRYRRFQACVGLDDSVQHAVDPAPSVNFTVFVDGICKFDSGTVDSRTAPRRIDIDVSGAQVLTLRLSDNWDNEGRSDNDHGDWADAKLIGKARSGELSAANSLSK